MSRIAVFGNGESALAQVLATAGRSVVMLGQSQGQLVDVLSLPTFDELEASPTWQTVNNMLMDGDGNDWPGGLFGGDRPSRPLPPPTMTRQQRRHNARKGNR